MKIKITIAQFMAATLIFAVVALVGCKKEISAVAQQDEETFATVSSESEAEVQGVFDDVFDNVMGVNADVAFGETGVFGRIYQSPDADPSRENRTGNVSSCYTVSITSVYSTQLFPVKVVIDFGSGCTGRDGRTRKGKIITVYTGRLSVPGKVAETYFEGYYVNEIHVEGALRIENASTSQALIFKISVKDGKLTNANGNYSQWNYNSTVTQIDGLGTPLYAKDDVFSIRGEATGAVKNGPAFFTWTSITREPLIKNFTCQWFGKGRIAIRRSNADAAIIDYGDGTCDNKATITINGATREITLR